MKILLNNKVRFQREKTFTDLKNGKYRYDFYLLDYNTIIEVDGQYHFYPIRGRAALLGQKERDRQKNRYALSRKIKLYRIPYWEINNISNFKDIFNNKYLVRSQYHNDLLKTPK